MNAFQFFVHRTAGLIKNINSAPLNLPEGAFYNLGHAMQFGAMIADKMNFTAIYDANGNLHTLVKKGD